METASYLRRQAAFYLRLSEFCPDQPIADHLRFKAADCHHRALSAEFDVPPPKMDSAPARTRDPAGIA